MDALKSIIPIAIGIGLLLTWSMPRKYSFLIKGIISTILVAMFCVSWFVWPGRPFYHSTNNGATASLSSFSAEGDVIMTISGSVVMSDELVPKLVESYMEENGYKNVKIENKDNDIEISGTINDKRESIIILPTSNKDGIRALEDGKTDVAISLIESPENDAFEEKEIGLDAVCVITNKDNPVTELTLAEVASIYEGTHKKQYNIYCMEEGNEYREFFDKEVMQGKRVSSSAKMFKTEKELIEALSKDPNGIGIIDFEYSESAGIRLVALKDSDNMAAIVPNDVTVQNENYSLSMRIYMYSLTKTKNDHVQKFLNWIESDEGQDIVDKSGFINFDVNMVTADSDAEEITVRKDDPAEYKKLINTSTPISTEFRFKFGGADLDSRAEDDIRRVTTFIGKHGYTKDTITLAGFTDNVGDINKNIDLSIKRANTVKDALIRQGLKNIKVVGLGPARPVRENITEEDRAENRRVEVWISK